MYNYKTIYNFVREYIKSYNFNYMINIKSIIAVMENIYIFIIGKVLTSDANFFIYKDIFDIKVYYDYKGHENSLILTINKEDIMYIEYILKCILKKIESAINRNKKVCFSESDIQKYIINKYKEKYNIEDTLFEEININKQELVNDVINSKYYTKHEDNNLLYRLNIYKKISKYLNEIYTER